MTKQKGGKVKKTMKRKMKGGTLQRSNSNLNSLESATFQNSPSLPPNTSKKPNNSNIFGKNNVQQVNAYPTSALTGSSDVDVSILVYVSYIFMTVGFFAFSISLYSILSSKKDTSFMDYMNENTELKSAFYGGIISVVFGIALYLFFH